MTPHFGCVVLVNSCDIVHVGFIGGTVRLCIGFLRIARSLRCLNIATIAIGDY